MKHRNIPISMVCTTDLDGVITPVKFRILHKDGTKVQYNIEEIKRIEHTRHCGIKMIFYYSLIVINGKPYDVVFRYVLESTKWELARI